MSGIVQIGELLEAIYRLDCSPEDWQARIADEVLRRRELGEGLLSYEFDASSPDGNVGLGTVVDVGDIAAFRELSAPVHQQNLRPEYQSVIQRGTHVGTFREVAEMYGLCPDESPIGKAIGGIGYHDIWAVCAVNPDATGIAFAVPFGDPTKATGTLPRGSRESEWAKVGVHIAAAHRLRRRLVSWTPDQAAGVFEPGGRERHLDPIAQQDRKALAHFVRGIEKARARETCYGGGELLSIWRGLLRGRWTIFDQIDTDGRRYMVVFENEPTAVGPRCLTKREIQVATYAAQGHMNKEIAYELGLSTSTVGTHLRKALSKLGLKSRTDLAWLYGELRDRPAP